MRARRASIVVGGVLLLAVATAASAGLPRACRPQPQAAAWLQQAREVFDPDAPQAAVQLWDAAMARAAEAPAPPCRIVETAWQIGDFLKLHARTSSDLALDYLNRGIAAHRPAASTEDLALVKLMKTAGHFFVRRGDRERACRSLEGAARVLDRLPDAEVTVLSRQVRDELVQIRCPVGEAESSPPTDPDQNR